MDGPYQLLNSLHSHDGPIRSLCLGPNGEIVTGCQADSPCIRRWTRSNNGSIEEIGAPIFHDHWVTALTSLRADSARNVHSQGCIISGCMDSNIRIFDPNGILLHTLTGHTKGIISFSWTTSGHLISGSWDGTARIWDLSSNSCILVLQPHENGVHVLGLSNGMIATVSTGEAVNGKPANFKLRIWNPSTGSTVGDAIYDHEGSIRSVAALPGVNGIITSSNDGSVILRSIEGEHLGAVQHVSQEDGSSAFILDCCALDSTTDSGSMEFVSCGEDGSVNVWSGTELTQAIPHPISVWCVLALGQGDFVSGGHDGVLRHFTRNTALLQENSAAQQLGSDFLREVAEAQLKRRRGPSSEELAKAPLWENRGQNPGTSENQVMVFNQSGTMIAAQWNSGSWIVIGEVTGSGDGGNIGEVWYDHVMPVEIETPVGLRNLKLGYNNGENPFVAAQRFIEANGLQQTYLNEIADWILSRAGNNVPTIGDAGGSRGPSAVAAASARPTPTFSFKVTSYAVFEELPVAAKLLAKVVELNGAANAAAGAQLTQGEVDLVSSALNVLCDASHYHSSLISAEQIRAVFKMALRWDAASVFPAYDVLRLLAVHPAGAETLNTLWFQLPLLDTAFALLSRDHASTPHTAALTCCRFLCNWWKSSGLRNRITSDAVSGNVARVIANQLGNPNKLVRAAVASLLMNLSMGSVSPSVGRMVVESSYRLIQGETESSDVLFRTLKAVGTVVLSANNAADRLVLVSGVDFNSLLISVVGAPQWSGKLNETTLQCVQELLNLLSSLR